MKPHQRTACLPYLSVSRPRGPPTGSWQWGSDGCCETWLSYWLHGALQQLVGSKRAHCATAKNVMWRSERVWTFPKGYPSQDLCIILPDGYRNRFGGCGWEREARRRRAGAMTVLRPQNVGSERTAWSSHRVYRFLVPNRLWKAYTMLWLTVCMDEKEKRMNKTWA